jgi:cystathionine gamma-lyase
MTSDEHQGEVVIKVRANGPYKVTGPVTLTDAHGNPLAVPADEALVLCRCGRSRTKPYCDKSHRTAAGSTAAVHAGLPAPSEGEPYLPGPVFAAPFHFGGDPAGREEPHYGRERNPTWSRWESAVGELEGGEAIAFASGMAAIAAVLMTALAPGDVLVAPRDGYYHVRELAEYLAARGIEVRLVPSDDAAIRDALPGARLLLVESPSNPLLDVVDIAAAVAAAHEAGALVAVDNTLATPLRQKPLALGADFSMSSATKQISGHSDLLLGHVVVGDPALAAGLREWRTTAGAIPGPFETWLAHRSIATLGLRVERQERNAAALAELLRARDDVAWVRWPGVGCVVSFDLVDAARAEAFLGACRLIAEATSFGGVHSSAERRARWGGDEISAGLVRMSAGCEDAEDLLADVAQALDAAR